MRSQAHQSEILIPAQRGFVPALEGMRAIAALAVLTTHVAFQVGTITDSAINRALGRLDLAVALFFALSGFLLWRTHALRARASDPGATPAAGIYLTRRLVRLMPAYLAVALAALLILPGNRDIGLGPWLANLSLMQVYVPDALTAGLTHMWSLSVEMSFYLVLPLLWMAMTPLRGELARWRIPLIAAVAAASLAWGYVPWHELGLISEGLNDQTLPPAFATWFAAGMILAELVASPPARLAALASRRWSKFVWWALAAVAFWATTNPAWFAEGFVHPSPSEFAARIFLGSLIAFLLLGPIALSPDHRAHFPNLSSSVFAALGRWSYGIFLWHVVVLYFAFELLDIPMFSGEFVPIWIATVALSIVAGAASYSLIEEPLRHSFDSYLRGRRQQSAPAAQTPTTESS